MNTEVMCPVEICLSLMFFLVGSNEMSFVLSLIPPCPPVWSYLPVPKHLLHCLLFAVNVFVLFFSIRVGSSPPPRYLIFIILCWTFSFLSACISRFRNSRILFLLGFSQQSSIFLFSKIGWISYMYFDCFPFAACPWSMGFSSYTANHFAWRYIYLFRSFLSLVRIVSVELQDSCPCEWPPNGRGRRITWPGRSVTPSGHTSINNRSPS